MLRLCLWALELYPYAWRERYGAELRALLEERDLSLGTLFDLLRGALEAHLDPRDVIASPRRRMRGSLAATTGCWLVTVLLGAGFAKATEDEPFRRLARLHPPVADVRLAIEIIALTGALVIALAGIPLVHGVLRQALRERTPALVRAIAAAAGTVLAFSAATAGLVLLSHGRHVDRSRGHVLFVLWSCGAVVVVIACALAARAGLMATRFRPGALVLGVAGAWLLARIMTALAVALAAYAVLLMAEAPALAGSPNGPLRLTTATVLTSQVLGMILVSVFANLTTRRGMCALRGD